ncbi:hypothetical protein DICPUDRAFT_93881 [Dictyostelium purpureum]|uniref:Dihydrolipoamide acetyltransferase component of pyruvate dehydrogenase complex n=1 Tax=Dictyostelium purpureum TaxID=5786 RepID=F0ZCV9_DICPU|nr:uncharacterized protein DICPUDRAFT_93881 [Dictyostelium purpureum]EGC38204.1 hypothetical protein DICPUDRAFT_93881 [Dictyostelium purpureum]|eukprot:XP_003285242.1 hypothetical protein DICPUDRAFT_93881 [Dictyostelium purpureum]
MLARQIVSKRRLALQVYRNTNKTTTTSRGISTLSFTNNNNNEFKSSLPKSSSSSSLLNCKNTFEVKRNYSSNGPILFNLADVGEGIAECEVLTWYVKEGDSIKEFDKLCEVQSDKATVEITSRYDGKVTKLFHKIGGMAKVGLPLVEITPEGGASAPSPAAAPSSPSTTAAPSSTPSSSSSSKTISHHENEITNKHGQKIKVLATPSVRHLAKANSIDLNKVQGTGKEGRVLKENILDFINGTNISQPLHQAKPAAPVAAPTTPAAVTPTLTLSSERESRVPISGIKKVMVKSMNAATAVPHFGFSEEYIMDKLTELRNQMKPMAEARGIKLSYMPFLIKATSLALLKYPVLNSSVSPDESQLIYKNYHNIGVAMDTPQGLLVPNIKNVESKSIFEIAQELNRLQKSGIAGQLTPSDMSGGTFSLSNIGTIGGTYCSPVLLLPEVCIGALGKIQKLPRFDKHGNVIPQSIMIISWSGDHRVIDGATIANFSNVLKGYIENPNTMLFDTR